MRTFIKGCVNDQVQLRGGPTTHPDRQRGGGAREREDREAHHEEHPWRAQPLHFRQCMFTPKKLGFICHNRIPGGEQKD